MSGTDPSSGTERHPIELLAEEFLERQRRGEHPALSEYTERYPELAEEIRDLFPALVVMERVKPVRAGAQDRDEPAAGPPVGHAAAARERLGDFRILREAARGGMGVVYKAVQESLGRHVAGRRRPRTCPPCRCSPRRPTRGP
jgi:hypothetical protein